MDPYPAVFLRCTYPFLPEELRPHVRSETFGTPYCLCNATSSEHAFSGLQSFRYVQAPPALARLDHQVAPTAEAYSLRAAGPFTPRNEHEVTHMSCGIATCLNRAIDMAGLSPAGLQPCRPLPRSVREDFPHTVPRFQPFLPSWKPNWQHPDWRITLPPIRLIRYYGLSWV